MIKSGSDSEKKRVNRSDEKTSKKVASVNCVAYSVQGFRMEKSMVASIIGMGYAYWPF